MLTKQTEKENIDAILQINTDVKISKQTASKPNLTVTKMIKLSLSQKCYTVTLGKWLQSINVIQSINRLIMESDCDHIKKC